ncbi:MAG: indole-3-glycerol phosphate synthase TrpC [Eggerthellaceae bacterium]|nr:indole-3-glycerol phosphate synthase TrpC [Eggerthellaceae bacterium]
MASILEELADAARARVAADKERIPLDEMRALAMSAPEPPSFYDALALPDMGFICECKKASPSKGLIAPDFYPVAIALDYEAAGAAAISVLTEPTRFLGRDDYLREVAEAVDVPVLRKDFVVDEYMIYQAKALGASAVLLICALLDADTLTAYLGTCAEIGLDALVEAHDDAEVAQAVASGARIIGVNNRNLADFTIDFENSIRLRGKVPPSVLFVTESGIQTADDIALLAKHDVNAVLIGETLMRAPDKRAMLDELRGGAR